MKIAWPIRVLDGMYRGRAVLYKVDPPMLYTYYSTRDDRYYTKETEFLVATCSPDATSQYWINLIPATESGFRPAIMPWLHLGYPKLVEREMEPCQIMEDAGYTLFGEV